MYDGVMRAIEILESSDDGGSDTAFLVVVFSDGLENSSTDYEASDVAEAISRLEDTGRWTFVYIGANQDLSDISKHLSFRHTASWDDTNRGAQKISNSMKGATVSYMSSRDAGVTRGGYDLNQKEIVDSVENDNKTS